jgi:serine/threonine protein kinase
MDKATAEIIKFFAEVARIKKGLGGDKVTWEWLEKYTGGDVYRIKIGTEIVGGITVKKLSNEESAKSEVFFVRFEGLAIAIKIPPVNMSLEDYLKAIKHDHVSAKAFEEFVPCLGAEVGLPLRLAFPKLKKTETDFLAELPQNPRWQRFLRMNGRLVFFMNLLKHPTFADELKKMHDQGAGMYDYLVSNIAFLRHVNGVEGFVRDHGEDQRNFFAKVESAYQRFNALIEGEIRKFNGQPGNKFIDIAGLFVKFICGMPLELPAELTFEVQEAISQLEADPYIGDVAMKLEGLIAVYLQRIHFKQRKSAIGCLCAKTLVLLSALHRVGWVHKDLKPGNAFVHKESGNEYGVPGFIDLETCAEIPGSANKFLAPNGTPQRSIIANYVRTQVLAEVYGEANLRTAFRFMDWYAALTMLFQIATARHLFEKTGAIFKPEILSLVTAERYLKLNAQEFREINARFWQEAKTEFERKIKEEEGRLREIEVDIKSPLVLEMFAEYFGKTKYAKYFAENVQTLNLYAVMRLMFARIESFCCQ